MTSVFDVSSEITENAERPFDFLKLQVQCELVRRVYPENTARVTVIDSLSAT